MKIRTTQYQGNKAEWWIHKAIPCISWWNEIVLDAYGNRLFLDGDKLVITDYEGVKARLPLSKRQVSIMQKLEKQLDCRIIK